MPRAIAHRLPQRDPRDAASFYAIGMAPAEPARTRPGADFPIIQAAQRSRLLQLVDRARALAAKNGRVK